MPVIKFTVFKLPQITIFNLSANTMKLHVTSLIFAAVGLINLAGCSAPSENKNSNSSRVLLAVFAHPDDEATVSPVLAKYAAEGVKVYLAIATDGRLGVTEHANIPAGDSLAATRTQELICAAEKLGIEPPIQFGLYDQLRMGEGYGPLHEQLNTMREKVKELFTTLKPDVVITWGASGWTGHHDHRLVSTVVTEVFQSQEWGKPTQLYYSAIPTGNLPANSPLQLATVDATYLTVKIPITEADHEKAKASWLCHKSQYTPQTIEGMNQLIKASLKGTAYFQPLVVTSEQKQSLFY